MELHQFFLFLAIILISARALSALMFSAGIAWVQRIVNLLSFICATPPSMI